MVAFPSVAWFEAVGARVAADREAFRRLGFFDADVGIQVGTDGHAQGFVVEFEGYGVKRVRAEHDPAALADFTIEGSLEAWADMLRNIAQHGEPDLDHTLNRLTMAGVPLRVVAADQLKTDLFYRFSQSIQAFFNEAARVPTEFAAG